MPPKRLTISNSSDPESDFDGDSLFILDPGNPDSQQQRPAKKRGRPFTNQPAPCSSPRPNQSAVPQVIVSSSRAAVSRSGTSNDNVEMRSGGGGSGGGGRGAPTPKANSKPAKRVESYEDVEEQVERHMKNATRKMIDASETVKINIGTEANTKFKSFVVFPAVLILHSKFFREFFTVRSNNIVNGPVNSTPQSNIRQVLSIPASASATPGLVPAPKQGPAAPGEALLARLDHNNVFGPSQSPCTSTFTSTSNRIKNEPKPGPIDLSQPQAQLGSSPATSIPVDVPHSLTLLQTITPAQFTCFLSWLYTGTVTRDSISNSTRPLNITPSLESLWFLGSKLGCPSFQNRVMQVLLASKEMHNGDWPSPSKVRSIEGESESLRNEQCVLKNLAVTCVAINTPLQKYEEGSVAAKEWDKLLDEKSSVVKEALRTKTKRWTSAKPWHKINLKLWLVPELVSAKTV